MPLSPSPLYLDWQFWSAVIAVLALVLTQLPPVRLWFKPSRLEVEVHSRVQVTHKVGNPNLGMYVSVRNIGGRELRIRGMAVSIARDSKSLGTYPAINYFELPSSTSPVLFVPFNIRPSETWGHGTNFLSLFDRNAEKFYRERESALRSDIRRKLDTRVESDKELVVADVENIKPFLDMFDHFFIWVPGEYTLDLRIDLDSKQTAFGRRFRFTLYESDSEELRSHTNDYKNGGGLSYNVDRHVGVSVPLSPNDA